MCSRLENGDVGIPPCFQDAYLGAIIKNTRRLHCKHFNGRIHIDAESHDLDTWVGRSYTGPKARPVRSCPASGAIHDRDNRFRPECPRWALSHGRLDLARKSARRSPRLGARNPNRSSAQAASAWQRAGAMSPVAFTSYIFQEKPALFDRKRIYRRTYRPCYGKRRCHKHELVSFVFGTIFCQFREVKNLSHSQSHDRN